jgi:hypothetical protein
MESRLARDVVITSVVIDFNVIILLCENKYVNFI